MSDQDKGLMDAEAFLPACISRAYCCFHLKENFITKFSRTLADLFWKIARSNTPQIFDHNIDALDQINPIAAAYLRNFPLRFWVAAFIPGRRYGQDTSNIVECINFDLKSFESSQLWIYFKQYGIKS